MGHTEILFVSWLLLLTRSTSTHANATRVKLEDTLREASQKPNLTLNIDQPRKSPSHYFHKLAQNVVLINYTGILTLRLDCWAPYPVDLQFDGHLTNQDVTVKTFRKQYQTSKGTNTLFLINATMESDEAITGNYTCASLQSPTKQSSYYIYVSPKIPGVLLTRKRHIFIQTKPFQTTVTFPCAVSNPGVHVTLYKNEAIVPQSPLLSFNPKKGFTMAIDIRDKSVYGDYSCATDLVYDRVNITLKPPASFVALPLLKTIRSFKDDPINISCDAVDDFEIIYSLSIFPVTSNEVERLEGSDLYYKYKGKFVSEPLEENRSGYVSCNWKATNKTFAEWYIVNAGNTSVMPGEVDFSRVKSVCANKAAARECNNRIECRMSSCHRNDANCESNNPNAIESGLIQCPSEGSSHFEIYFTGFPTENGNKTVRYSDWKHASEEELLHIEEIPGKVRITKTHIETVMSCQGSNFVFSSGFCWIIHFEQNSTLLVLENFLSDSVNATVQNMWKDTKSNLESRLTLSMKKPGKKILFIECKAPVWDSWQWISRNLSFDARYRSDDIPSTNMAVDPASKTSILTFSSLILLTLLRFQT